MCKECEKEHRYFVCECGKEFERLNQMTGHQANCKVHQKLLEEEREKRRLPNGLFKCENPDCTNEHDGSFASGRFCCKKCYRHTMALRSAISRRLHPVKRLDNRSPHGTWHCKFCDYVGNTRNELKKHWLENPNHRLFGRGLKGKTKETDERLAILAKAQRERYRSGKIIPHFLGCHHSAETKKKISESMKQAHKDGRANNFAKSRHSCGVNMSYPEAWFLAVIKNEFEDQNFQREYPFFRYSFDFAWVDKKKVI